MCLFCVWGGSCFCIQSGPSRPAATHTPLERHGVLDGTLASQSPSEPTPAAPPPLISRDEQPPSAKLPLQSQPSPLPLPLAPAEWMSFSTGLCLLGRFQVKAGPLGSWSLGLFCEEVFLSLDQLPLTALRLCLSQTKQATPGNWREESMSWNANAAAPDQY